MDSLDLVYLVSGAVELLEIATASCSTGFLSRGREGIIYLDDFGCTLKRWRRDLNFSGLLKGLDTEL
jgi:hypothetical protein